MAFETEALLPAECKPLQKGWTADSDRHLQFIEIVIVHYMRDILDQ